MLVNNLKYLICLGISLTIVGLLITFIQFIPNLFCDKRKKLLNKLGYWMFQAGLIATISPLPAYVSYDVHSAVGFIFIGLILILVIQALSCILYFAQYIIYGFQISNSQLLVVVIYIALSITFAITLYPEYKVEKVCSEDFVVYSDNVREVCIFNNIPLNSNLDNINIYNEKENEYIKEDENKIEFVKYWYIGDNNEMHFDKVPATNTVLTLSKDNIYFMEEMANITLTKYSRKRFLKHFPEMSLKKVYKFYLPKEIVGTE